MTRFILAVGLLIGVNGSVWAVDEDIDRVGTEAFAGAHYVVMQVEIEALKKSVADLTAKNDDLQKKADELATARDEALALRKLAERDAKEARQLVEAVTKKYESLMARVEELKLALPKEKPVAPPPPREGIRGVVDAYADGLVVLNIGADTGLATGMELDVYRTAGAKYLGKVTIVEVTPKKSVGKFKPSTNVPAAKLPADDLPKAGDSVGSKPEK